MNRLHPARIDPEPCPITSDAAEIAEAQGRYRADESKLSSPSLSSVALPKSAAQLVAILEAHRAAGHHVTVSGARTGVVGGAVAPAGGHVVSLEGLRGIGELERRGDEATIRVAAGTTLAELYEHLAGHHPDWIYPVDPTETSASIGGTVATNASGPRSFHYGPTRDWVRGLRVVLADGGVLDLERGQVVADGARLEIERAGGNVEALELPEIPRPATKHSLGYRSHPGVDAVDLFIGAEGTLGVVTDVTLGLAPRPRQPLYLLQLFDDEDGALGFVEWLRGAAPFTPLAIEYWDRRSLALVAGAGSRYAAMVEDATAAAVYVEIALEEGEAALEAALEAIGAELERLGAPDDKSGAGTAESDRLEMKAFRHQVPERVNALVARRKRDHPGLHKLATDMAVPDDALRRVHHLYRERLAAAGFDFAIFGHVGDNHFHVNLLPRDEDELARAKQAYRELAGEVVGLGGAVSAEHGIGRLKRDFLAIQFGPEVIEGMRRIKRFFDPGGMLNPGVLFGDLE